LRNYQNYLGQTLSLTGPRATTISDVAKLVEKQTGRKVNVKIVGRAEAEAYHLKHTSLPSSSHWIIESWAGWHGGIAKGETAMVDPFIAEVLGRQPRGIEEIAKQLFTPQ
jgi:NAD(P)H dehydrogenase (quinone)